MKKHIYGYLFLKFSKLSRFMKFFTISFLLLFFVRCNNAPDPVKKELNEIAKEIMTNAKNCALITIDSLGAAHARAMDPFLPEEDFTVWMATKPSSLKIKQLQGNNNVTLYYFEKESVSYVTLQGTASIVNSQNEKEKFWKKEWKNFYKNRTSDYALIKFIPKVGNVISEKYKILGDSITWETPKINF
jgi:general stress protein 26